MGERSKNTKNVGYRGMYCRYVEQNGRVLGTFGKYDNGAFNGHSNLDSGWYKRTDNYGGGAHSTENDIVSSSNEKIIIIGTNGSRNKTKPRWSKLIHDQTVIK